RAAGPVLTRLRKARRPGPRHRGEGPAVGGGSIVVDRDQPRPVGEVGTGLPTVTGVSVLAAAAVLIALSWPVWAAMIAAWSVGAAAAVVEAVLDASSAAVVVVILVVVVSVVTVVPGIRAEAATLAAAAAGVAEAAEAGAEAAAEAA